MCIRDRVKTESGLAAVAEVPKSGEREVKNFAPVEELPVAINSASEGAYVASKNSTKYHLPWCGSAKRIADKNKIWFASKAEAEATGRTPAANCPGI